MIISTPFENLILVRLLETRKQALTEKEIGKSLLKTFEDKLSAGEFNSQLTGFINNFLKTGFIEEVPKKNSSHKSRYILTSKGQETARSFLGASYFPEKLTWDMLKDKYLVACELEISINSSEDFKRLSSSGFLPKAIVKRELNLQPDLLPEDKNFWDGVLWYALGENTNRRFLLKEVKQYLINKVLDGGHELKEAEAKKQLPAKLVKALNPSPDALRQALLSRIFEKDSTDAVSGPEDAYIDIFFGTDDQSLKMFANKVLDIAKHMPTGRYGMDKAFISHVWRYLSEQEDTTGLTLDSFKSRLLKAGSKKYLTLARADLPDQLNTGDVEASETIYLNTLFHFIRI